MERKLAAILAADVVGYSAHMERDEALSPCGRGRPSDLSEGPERVRRSQYHLSEHIPLPERPHRNITRQGEDAQALSGRREKNGVSAPI
jgi:hypothetical protein